MGGMGEGERGPRGYPFVLIQPIHINVYPPLKYQRDIKVM
jgi:hypothetical protein